MLAACASFLLLKFAICEIPDSSAPYCSTVMTDQAAAAASADRASMNYTKDAYGISPLATLSGINLNNRKVASQYYEDTRTAMIRRLQMVDGLYDLAVDFGSKLKKTYKRGGSTVIWKCSWGYKIAPQNKNNSKLKKQKETKVECTVHTPKSGLRIVLR